MARRNVQRISRRMRGGSSAAQYGSAIFPDGAVGQLSANAASNAAAGANQVQALNPAQVWTGCGGKGKGKGKGKKQSKKMGGSGLLIGSYLDSDHSPVNLDSTNVANNAGMVGGSGKAKVSVNGGTLLVDIAVPAALVYTNQVYPRKNKSRKSNSKKSTRRYRRK